MESRNLIRILVVVSLFLAVSSACASQQTNTPAATAGPAILSGRTATLLPDGTLLLAGGQDAAGRVTGGLRIRDAKGQERELATILHIPRSAHTATVLPDGTVLLAGGVGSDGQLVQQAEIFDPQAMTLQLLDPGAPAPRAFHSATLLTDGRVLLAGGIAAGGQPLDTAEFWDPRQKTSVALTGRMTEARWGHAAALLPDGTVFLNGGKGADSNPLSTSNVFDPQTQTFLLVIDPAAAQSLGNAQSLRVEASLPQNGARDVPVDVVLALRFSRPLNVTTVNAATVLLKNSTSPAATVVAAEGGMLVFITPSSPLEAGVTYTLTLRGLADKSDQALPETIITFTTAGAANAPGSGGGTDTGLNSPWRKLPALEAAPGMTALAGQVLKLNGDPLPHVLLEIDKKTTYTDKTGRFLLRELTAGHHILYIDGAPANADGAVYGLYRVGVDITAGQTNVLNYTIWMTALDMEHVVRFPSPTTSEVVVTNPTIPGLELHIPPDTVIRDARGRVVTELGITQIPMQQPPFPLKRGVVFPVYFTIQPGGASFSTAGTSWSTGQAPRGAQIRYQNYPNAKAGTRFDFWNYDPAQKGWYVYGKGRVSGDQRMIIPDNGTQIWSFDGAMVSVPGNAPDKGPKDCGEQRSDPVDLQTGLFIHSHTDLSLPDVIPITITRTYRQSDYISRAFGIGSSLPYDMFMIGDSNCCVNFPEGYTYQDLVMADGGRIHFTRTSPCNGYCGYGDAVYTATSTPGEWYGATLRWSGGPVPGTAWVMKKKDGTYYYFRDSDGSTSARWAAVIGMQDRHGNILTFTRDSAGNLLKITSPNGRWVQFTYDASSRITQAQDNIGRTVSYTYDSTGRLHTFTDANNGVTTYEYDADDNMVTITDARRNLVLTNQYDANGRIWKQTHADNGTYVFIYTPDANGNIVQTDMTDPRGIVERVVFNSDGYSTSDIKALGLAEQQTFTYERQAATGCVLTFTDALNRRTAYTYDAMGNITSNTRLAGTAAASVTTYSYEPAFNQVSTITDPLGHTTSMIYDDQGNPIISIDQLGNTRSFAYNTAGQPVSTTDPLGSTTAFSYDSGDLSQTIDPLNRIVTSFSDSAGRLASVTDASGRITAYQYTPMNQISVVTDKAGNLTSFTYDANGNVLTVADPNNHVTTYTYNSMNQMQSMTDPLNHTESYEYDKNGNLIKVTDRRGKIIVYNYDGLNRQVFAGFGLQGGSPPTYELTLTSAYDAGNHLTRTQDSNGNIITRGYDGLDNLSWEQTSKGRVDYTYTANLRQSMTVFGQPSVNYTYDAADRVQQISRGNWAVLFRYDASGRKEFQGLPNGVSANYEYDAASQLVKITYQSGGSAFGDLLYSYDLNGNRVGMTGSLARTALPDATGTITYNEGNQLVQWGAATLTYDGNGNMLSDGSNTYAWNAHNQLASINAGASSFEYDALGRRSARSTGAARTDYLYDGANVVQEWTGNVPTANMLAGAVDQYFIRSDAGGAQFFLADALGSTVELLDGNGLPLTQYTYEPFGKTYATGPNSANITAYAGREYENANLYYYRARYYDPVFGRFISQDPIGFEGGINFYAYVLNNPVNLTDPTGLKNCDCSKADPLPASTPKCYDYGSETYLGVSLKCFCQCAGDGEWSQKVRGCLACEHGNGTNAFVAHAKCYAEGGPKMPVIILGKCYKQCFVAFGSGPKSPFGGGSSGGGGASGSW